MKKFITITILLTQSLSCMNVIWHNPNIKNSAHLQLAQRYFSHDSICALALVNTKWNTFITETAGKRRQALASEEEYKKERFGHNSHIYQQTTWHKHNSAYSYWKRIEKSDDKKTRGTIGLYLVYLSGNNTIQTQSVTLTDLPNFNINGGKNISQNPSFTRKGDVSCHAYEPSNPQLKTVYQDLVINEYILSTKKEAKKFTCYVDIMHKNSSRKRYAKENLANIDARHPLLKAILQSKRVTRDGSDKIYHIDGVEFDENYLLNGKFPLLTGEFACPAPRVAYRALISRCIITNPKIFLLLCGRHCVHKYYESPTYMVSQLPLKVVGHIASFLI